MATNELPPPPSRPLRLWWALLVDARDGGRAWLEQPGNPRRLARVLLPVLVAAGLLLPPVSLWTRLTTLDYVVVRPGGDVSVPSDLPGASLDVRRLAVYRTTRMRLRTSGAPPAGVGALPAGHELESPFFRLDIRGPVPREAWLAVPIDVGADEHAFVDPYGWDGVRWRWLAPQFSASDRVQVYLPLGQFVPQVVVVTRATASATEVSAALLPPPAVAPAAVAELPILEMRAYHLARDDGEVAGGAFPLPTRDARRYGVFDNLEGDRLRTDLVNNVLILPASRQRHRQAILAAARRDDLDGVVLDYRGIAGDLQPTYVAFVRRLAADLHRSGIELVVTVPMPRRTSSAWDASPYSWRELADAADGLRVALPNDAPLEISATDSLVRWALRSVERRRLQLAVPVRGRDVLEGEVVPIGYGEALSRILDMARSDAPDRLSPGTAATVELPTLREAKLGRDPATGMWRFFYWDASRRPHTVWLNDAAGLAPAFEVAVRYRLGRLALDGVEAGLDPSLWRMVTTFLAEGRVAPPDVRYRLRWQLIDAGGQVVQQADQPLDQASFEFRGPRELGEYRLAVNLVTADEQLAAVGGAAVVRIAPPPPPTPEPTVRTITVGPTPETVVTAPPPADEARLARVPVPISSRPAGTAAVPDHDAEVSFAKAELRAGPSVTAPIVSGLRTGDRLSVEGQSADGEWLSVVVIATGIQGWVHASLVTLRIAPDEVPVVAAATPTPTPARR